MNDRRRVNGPSGVTSPPVFTSSSRPLQSSPTQERNRVRAPSDIRKIFIKTGLTPSASGSAYLELEPPPPGEAAELLTSNTPAGLKLSCTVHGPRPLPRPTPFSPHLLLSAHVKFAPFASRKKRGYIRDASERDLSVHLETALRGVIIGERWPKSGLEISITVLEGEEESPWNKEGDNNWTDGWGMMSTLSGCITAASAAISDAGIDCVDFVTGGMAAVVRQPFPRAFEGQRKQNVVVNDTIAVTRVVLDPTPSEHQEIVASCVVAYLQSRDEITEIWAKGATTNGAISQISEQTGLDLLIGQAMEAARAARLVLIQAISESTHLRLGSLSK